MKTKILKWDVTIQEVLIGAEVLSFVCAIIFLPLFLVFVFLPFFGLLYQTVGSGIHLLLEHKSIGYRKLRFIHFWGSIGYILLVVLLWITQSSGPPTVVLVEIPQFIFCLYFALCQSELKYLERREFHILR